MFLGFVIVGLAAGALHNLLPHTRHVRWSAYFLGLAGAWFGGYCTAAFIQHTFVTMGWLTMVGASVSALLHVELFELAARKIVALQTP